MINEKNTVISPKKTDLPCLYEILAESFMDYPLMQYFFPEITSRKQKLLYLMRLNTDYAYHFGRIYTSSGLEGVMLTTEKEISSFELFSVGSFFVNIKLGLRALHRIDKIAEIQSKMRKRICPKHHIYILGGCVRKIDQGKKIATSVFRVAQLVAKQKNIPLYLETVKKENQQIYSHLGFEVKQEYYFKDLGLTDYAMIWDPEKNKDKK
jgi:hypothetical protein